LITKWIKCEVSGQPRPLVNPGSYTKIAPHKSVINNWHLPLQNYTVISY